MGYVVKFYWLVKFATWISLTACLTVRFDLSDYKLLVSFFCQFFFITLRISCLLAKFKKGECKVWHKKFYFFHFHANKLIDTQKVCIWPCFCIGKPPLLYVKTLGYLLSLSSIVHYLKFIWCWGERSITKRQYNLKGYLTTMKKKQQQQLSCWVTLMEKKIT